MIHRGSPIIGFTKPYSEKTAELIDREVKQIIDESFDTGHQTYLKAILRD